MQYLSSILFLTTCIAILCMIMSNGTHKEEHIKDRHVQKFALLASLIAVISAAAALYVSPVTTILFITLGGFAFIAYDNSHNKKGSPYISSSILFYINAAALLVNTFDIF